MDLVISIDSTASMYPCLSKLRSEITKLVGRLFDSIPDLKLSIVAHGDYCTQSTFVTKHIGLTTDKKKLCTFINSVERTGGYWDDGEAYEQVLALCNTLQWRPSSKKIVVVCGDDIPHPPFFRGNVKKTDWRAEVKLLKARGVKIFGVQCLGYDRANFFYKELASSTNGYHIKLDQLSFITDIIITLAYSQHSNESVEEYASEMKQNNRYTRNMRRVVNQVLDRKVDSESESESDNDNTDLVAVNPSRFQSFHVPTKQSIKQFVQDQGITFKAGRGFYELVKRESVSTKKEVVLMNPDTNMFYTGSKARDMLGLPNDKTIKIKPIPNFKYNVFIKSTSHNRVLTADSNFLYEVDTMA